MAWNRTFRAAAAAVSTVGVAAAASAGASARPAVPSAPIAPLASSSRSPLIPTTVLVHGLDSSKETFSGTLNRLVRDNYPCISLDLRGHGESSLGNENDFSAPALAADVLSAIRDHGIERAVLVGHSMGGRIAMRAAAIDACSSEPVLRAVVIEDMDVRERALPDEVADPVALARFAAPEGRRFPSWEHARRALLPWYDYDESRVDKWRGTRVRQISQCGEVWSDINPAAQRLARLHVLASSDGSEAWDQLAARASKLPFSVHVLYADELDTPGGTVVTLEGKGGIQDMRARLPAAEFVFFRGAGHSIHRTAQEAFDSKQRDIINMAAK